jgi:anti-anti-sigma factor
MPDESAKSSVEVRMDGQSLIIRPRATELYHADDIEHLGHDVRYAIDRATGATGFILDLSTVTFLTSAALGLVINLNSHLKKRGFSLAVAGAKGEVVDIFKHARLADVMMICPTVKAALDHFQNK